MTERQKCECCGDDLRVQWSDTHGIGVCIECGLPYRIYHRDESGKLLDKAPEVCVTEAGIKIARAYWAEKKRRVYPACYDMGIDRSGRSYSGATAEDCKAFGDWYAAHKHEYEVAA
jgi:hypothetical protein